MFSRFAPLAGRVVPASLRFPVILKPVSFMSSSKRLISTANPIAEQAARSRSNRVVLGAAAVIGIAGIGLIGSSMSSATPSVAAVAQRQVFSDTVHGRIRDTYACLGGGIMVTAASAVACFRSVGLRSFAMTSPWLMLGATVGTMFLTMTMPKDNLPLKAASFGLFNGVMGLSLAPLVALGGPLVLTAAAYTGAIVGSLSFVAATSPSERFLFMGAPLAMGLGAVVVASIGGMFLPLTSAVGSALYNFSLYGGLALFSGFVLFDTSKVIHHAETLPADRFDPFNESLSIHMDTINIFVRIVTILAQSKSNNRK